MSLLHPNRHKSSLPNLVTDAEVDQIVALISANHTTQFATINEQTLLAALQHFTRPGQTGSIFDDFFLFGRPAEAAKRYRASQLRKLIRSFLVKYRDDRGNIDLTKAYHRVTTMPGVAGSHGYVHTRHILGNPKLEAQVLQRMAKQRALTVGCLSHMRNMSGLIKKCKAAGKYRACPPPVTYVP